MHNAEAHTRSSAFFDCLTDVSRCFQTGRCPGQSAEDVATVLLSAVCAEDRRSVGGSGTELTGIGVSLVEKITSSLPLPQPQPQLQPQSLFPAALSSYCLELHTVLFQHMGLMTPLVHLFQAEDRIISHLAAKTVSTCVFYQLLKSGAVCSVWEQKCLQTFAVSAPGTKLDACLWSLTELCKRLLRGAHQEILWNLLAVFDLSLSALCSRFLPEERTKVDPSSSSRHWGTSFCLLLDLLEVLTASRGIRVSGVCAKSQRLTHLSSSVLLTETGRSSSPCFVRRRALLLLKRAMLQKAGEDWALGEALCAGPSHAHYTGDTNTLACSVLRAVDAGWLQGVEPEPASFFGGSRPGGGGHREDCCVMLRAVSLLVVKSIELHVHTAAGTAGVNSATEDCGYLHSLFVFLRRHSVQLNGASHLCSWVSVLFGEQDDDMMEAAKALLSISLHHRRCCGPDGAAVSEQSCASGCNPHCHFLFLLRSISFDHSILLDFLISTETCFLEYLVRFLKLLRADWQGFIAACQRVAVSDRQHSLQRSLSASSGGGGVLKGAWKGEPSPAESCARATAVTSQVEIINLTAGLRLVDYESSDESDPEDMEVSQDEPKKSGFSSSNGNQETSGPSLSFVKKQYESSHLNSTVALCPNVTHQSTKGTVEPSAKAVLCLSELREVVVRLHIKKLFPYNPSSLLRLLEQVVNDYKNY